MSKKEGSAKKFLYNGPPKPKDQAENREWHFSSRKKEKGDPVDLDTVWSIKKNVGVNKDGVHDDKLTFNADTKFYSRYNNLAGHTGQIRVTNGLSEGKQPVSANDPVDKAFYQRRNSNTSRRHSLTPEDELDF
ncbi:hypothetical protein LOTGIDRAFT_154485 [Lottia gigantea]|uniref:Uncharacterized protein n=1 Tax=Lottia gigantea TaxID=225164 RepID=V3ZYC5_LOTGI|nr:hypothetical protein LOTGIDRAFT_154485 [Lottia gigantea]ESO89377.1 hypothetical protein LOTGIDRAFT_154485 [Lottia gigantea]